MIQGTHHNVSSVTSRMVVAKRLLSDYQHAHSIDTHLVVHKFVWFISWRWFNLVRSVRFLLHNSVLIPRGAPLTQCFLIQCEFHTAKHRVNNYIQLNNNHNESTIISQEISPPIPFVFLGFPRYRHCLRQSLPRRHQGISILVVSQPRHIVRYPSS